MNIGRLIYGHGKEKDKSARNRPLDKLCGQRPDASNDGEAALDAVFCVEEPTGDDRHQGGLR